MKTFDNVILDYELEPRTLVLTDGSSIVVSDGDAFEYKFHNDVGPLTMHVVCAERDGTISAVVSHGDFRLPIYPTVATINSSIADGKYEFFRRVEE